MRASWTRATNVTRYYNLELVTGSQTAAIQDDPIAAWFERVTKPVLARHYKDRYRTKDERKARLVDDLMSDFTLVRHQGEAGEEIRTVYDALSEFFSIFSGDDAYFRSRKECRSIRDDPPVAAGGPAFTAFPPPSNEG